MRISCLLRNAPNVGLRPNLGEAFPPSFRAVSDVNRIRRGLGVAHWAGVLTAVCVAIFSLPSNASVCVPLDLGFQFCDPNDGWKPTESDDPSVFSFFSNQNGEKNTSLIFSLEDRSWAYLSDREWDSIVASELSYLVSDFSPDSETYPDVGHNLFNSSLVTLKFEARLRNRIILENISFGFSRRVLFVMTTIQVAQGDVSFAEMDHDMHRRFVAAIGYKDNGEVK